MARVLRSIRAFRLLQMNDELDFLGQAHLAFIQRLMAEDEERTQAALEEFFKRKFPASEEQD